MLGFPVDGPGFVAHLKTWLSTVAQEADRVFPDSHVTIDHGEPVIHKSARRNDPAGLKNLEKLLAPKIQDVHLLEIMAHVQHWLHWCGCFGPLSGCETKLEDATLRQMLAVFAYGTQMGPAQMARSFARITSRSLSWIHHEHISEEKLDAAITRVINGYARFDLPRRWGCGKRELLPTAPSGRFTRTICSQKSISGMVIKISRKVHLRSIPRRTSKMFLYVIVSLFLVWTNEPQPSVYLNAARGEKKR